GGDHADGVLRQAVDMVVEAEVFARHADARSLQPIRLEEAYEVVALLAYGAEKDCRVGDRARHRTGGVLTVRDGDDARAADHAQTTEPSVSVPMPTTARLAATAAPVPELDPHALRSRTYGLCVSPPRPLHPLVECVERKFAHSLRLVLPMITAPALHQRME